jgi:hypothetical protein
MERDPLFVALIAELLRARLPELEDHLKSRYKDSGQAAGPRREKFMAIVEESHYLAVEAIKRIQEGPKEPGQRTRPPGSHAEIRPGSLADFVPEAQPQR